MPIVLGLGGDAEWNDPLNFYGGTTPTFGLGGEQQTGSATRTAPIPSMSDRDYSDLVDTVIAEAVGEGDEGMAAVASVIRNRASVRGKSAGEIVREPRQFTGYENPGADVRKAQQDPATRARAAAIVDGVFGGTVPDPTGGADHYHASSVSPDWSQAMPETGRIGRHIFYASGKRPGNAAEAIEEIAPEQVSLGLDTGDEPALAGRDGARVPNPKAKGLARLVSEKPAAKNSGGGRLNFVHPGQEAINPAFASILTETSAELGRDFTITSGYRSPSHRVERRKKSPGQHSHRTAADISMRGMSDAERAELVRRLHARGVKRFGTYSGSPDMLHVDMKDQRGDGSAWFMHDTTNARLSKAPAWFREIAANPGAISAKVADGQSSRPSIVIDENFKPADALGIYGGENPFAAEAEAIRQAKEEAAARSERERADARIAAANDAAGGLQRELAAESPDRYQLIDEDELPEWQQRWEEENRSGGVGGDVGRIVGTGNANLGLAVREAVGMIPGVGDHVVSTLDAIDEWVTGKPVAQRLREYSERAGASVTAPQAEADAKTWWDSERGTFGPAWSDPRSYLRAVGESAPGTVVTMLPGGVLARGSYLSAVASGTSQRAAAAAAARTATIAGAISEGMLGGADASIAVKEQIARLPADLVAQSDAVKAMVAGGMSQEEAIKAVTEDASVQAFLMAGAATGAFGGMGDRALAKILAEGVGGTVAQRILRGAARGAVAEGLLEEAPQGAAQTIAQNRAVQTVNPDQDLTEGVGEAVAGGIAAGGVMGGGMGAAGGAASPSAGSDIDLPAQTGTAGELPDPESRGGPLRRAVDHAASRERERAPVTAPLDTTGAGVTADGRPEIGATVRVDADGLDPFMARIDGYEGDEAVIIDSSSGEIYQVPIENITQIAPAVGADPSRRADPLPVESGDPALEPLDPQPGVTTSEIPPSTEDMPADEKRPYRPRPGERVIIDTPETGRRAVRIERYEENGREAVVVDDDGTALQVPVDRLSVSKLTPSEVEAQELERNPPVEREIGDAGPNSRRIGDKTLVLPDDNHARLYDLAREQVIAKRLGGTSQVDMASVLPAERKRLADAFGVAVEDIAAMADDYRYRAERAAKEAKSRLPVKMHAVNERLLKQRQAARARQEASAPGAVDDGAQWWDVDLTQVGRRDVLARAGVKRPDRVMWRNLTPGIKAKLLSVRDAQREAERIASDIGTVTDAAAHEAATSPANDLPEPSQAQKEAGNYKVGRIRLGGLDISIENPAGSERKGVSASGKAWSVTMKSHYGYIRGTVGRDKDHIDIFVKPGTEAIDDDAPVFVVDQRDPARGRFDEHKVMAGYTNEEEARAAYLENYTKGWTGLGSITPTTMADFKAWLRSGKTAEPFATKWFASREKAEAHIARGKLGDTHHVVQNGKRFEIREKAKEHQPSPAEPRDTGRERRSDVSRSEVRDVLRSKEFRQAYAEIAQSQMGTPHPDSPVAYEMVRGWLDEKAGRPPTHQEVPYFRGGVDPIEPYYMGYAAARYGKARVIRASTQEAAYQELSQSRPGPEATKTKAARTPAKPKPDISANTIFTDDAAEKARALLRRKLAGNTLNSGIDPELLQAGITLAGYHIEKGARTFAAYAKAMLADLGEGARPYLKSWYMGVKYDPRAAAFDGMSSAAEVEAADVDKIGSTIDEPAELDQPGPRALEGTPSEPVPGTESGRDAGNGAEGRGRADVSRGGSARTERVPARRGVADGQGDLLAAAAGERAEDGDQRDAGDASARRRRPDGQPDARRDVDEGPFGPILRGYEGRWRDAALELERRQTGDAVGALSHPDVGPIDLVWGNAGTNQHNGAGLAKLLAWHPEVLTDLQGFIDGLHVDEAQRSPRRIQLIDETGRAGVRLDFDGTAKTWLLTAFRTDVPRRSDRSTATLQDLWKGENAGRDARSDTAPAKPSDANASRRTGAKNVASNAAEVQSAAVPAQARPVDYVITDADELGTGGQKAKFATNVRAIKLLRRLEEEKRPATRDEQSVLAKWVGWGGLRAAFPREDGSVAGGWEKEAAELKALLSPEEYSAAESSTRNAHYTAPEVVSAIWDIMRRLGFRGGQMLEPSVGAGNFLGLMPGDLRSGTAITGVELDRITGSIAKHLYPTANIQAPIGFEKLTVPDDHFDVVAGNPPFGSERLYDRQRRHLNKFSIHNFFIAKSVEALRPGGVLAMVVTNRFLDGANAAARQHIAKSADLVGAIRLPNNAFLRNAGTEVTTDIVLLRRRQDGDTADKRWVEVGTWTGRDGKPVPLNRYFIDNPDMMLGDFGAFGTMYGPDDPALVARDGADLAADLAEAVRSLPENVMPAAGAPVAQEAVTVPETVSDVEVGTMFSAPDGTVHVRLPDHIGQSRSEAVAFPNETARERVAGMVRVRDAFAKLRRAQIDERATDGQVENLRKRLNVLYDGFVKKHGPINADVNKRLFRDDPTWPQISALEHSFDKGVSATMAKKTGETAKPPSAGKSAIFTRRTQQPYRRPTSAASAKDALATVLNDHGRVNLDAMSALYGKPVEAIIDELGPLLFRTPAGAYETADHYLSRNVKAKLAEAERAAERDPAFRRNVAALRDVIPADIEAVDIDVKPGAPWLPARHVADFITHIAGSASSAGSKAVYSRANARWEIDVPSVSAAAATMYGTDRAGVGTVLSAVLNGQQITVHDRTSDGKSVVNQAATDAANEKAERVKAEWRRWLWADDTRRAELARLYNDTFNTDVERTYDGSHLTFPGKVGDDIIAFRPHQKNFVWRTLQSGTALADHTVGAGKTFAAIASAMEKRRIGQARKPMFVVPNHLVGQWAADFVRLYPGAKILAATKADFEKDRRKLLFARIATGDWDAVIVAHSSFGRIGMSPEYEARFIAAQMDDLEASIDELRRETGQRSRNVAQLTKWRDNLKAKMERLLDAGKKDDGLTFDELGIDALYVDEAHEFKNLAYSTSMQRVAGLGNTAGSQKAADLFMKTRFILERTGGNNVVFLSGTPVSNTMAEMYTILRYLAEDVLRAMGISHFDAWARVFGEIVTDWELSPSGQYRLNSRFAKFVNVPELMQRYRSFADVVTNDDIKAQLAAIGKTLPLPKVKGGKPTNIVVERSSDQAAYIGEGKPDQNGNLVFPKGSLVHRAENLPKKVEKGADNMLKVMSDARKAALDMRLIDTAYPDHTGSKVHRAADEMKRMYDAWDKERGTQLVFIDLSTPKKVRAAEEGRIRDLMKRAEEGDEAAQEALDNMSPDDFLALQSPFSVYDDLREKLIDRGVPPAEIAFIHDANTEAQKEELFGKVRTGRVRFLFGSTAKMGAGTNVQNRLVGLHHLDAPWRPSDLEQRDGRGIRQGNELYIKDPDGFEIEILRYATKNTLDARQWQTIEAKARFIQQLRKGDVKTREIEDIAGEAANAAEMKAAASGNPLILEEMETRRKLRQLESQAIEHDREQHRIKGRIRSLQDEAERLRARRAAVEADAALARDAADAPFSAAVGSTTFDKPKDFGATVAAEMRRELIEHGGADKIGSYAGFDIGIEHLHDRAFSVTITGARRYEVDVHDAADVDATGLAMRIVNTVRRLVGIPEADSSRLTDIEAQVPALEKQIGSWNRTAELEETASRHRRLLDALRPRPAGAATLPSIGAEAASSDVAPMPAVKDKRPDTPVTGADGKLRSLPAPGFDAGRSIRANAVDLVRRMGEETGHEYLVAFDDDGALIDYGTAGDDSATGMNNKLLAALVNPDRRVVVYHNHPRNGPLSRQDLANLAYPGLYSVWAIGAGGAQSRAALSHSGNEVLAGFEDPGARRRHLDVALGQAHDRLRQALQNLITNGHIEPQEATRAHPWALLRAAERAGLVDTWTENEYDPATLRGLDQAIDEAAVALARSFFNDRARTIHRVHRPAVALGHIAELADAPRLPGETPARRPGAGEFAEGSQNDYSREARRRGEGRAGKRVTEARIVEELRGKLTDLQPALLKAIPLNYFSELARPNMTAVGEYLRVKRLMDAFRGKKHAEADAVAQEWLRYTRLGFAGKDKAKAQALADLMHEATLAGIDPSRTDEETKALPGYTALRKRFMELPPKGRTLFEQVRDAYKAQAEELDAILLDNVRKAQEIALRQADERYKRTLQKIRDAGLSGIDRRNAEEDAASAHKAETTKARWAAKARMTRMRLAFEASRVQAPYFPLGRFGRYFVTARDIDGRILSFSKHETEAARTRAVRELQRELPTAKIESGVMEAGSDLRRAMDPRIVAEIEEILGGAGVGADIMDQIWQRYLESMPDLSTRKRFIHRKGTAGFARDALRVFSSHMFHASHQMARLKYGLELQELVDQAVDQAREADDQARGMTLANELSSRHEWVMNPTGGKLAQTMTSTAFVWFLAASPAAAVVNMTQTVMLGVPILGARFGGLAKAAAAIGRASRDTISGRGSVLDADLTADERKAMEAFYESGLIDRTQSHDLAGVGETGVEYTPLRAKVMSAISWMFHRAEVWNREVTALAAYRMARAAGQSTSAAIDTAHDLTWKTHFDYANSSRPALMQNDFAKVALVFRQHNINMLYRMFRDLHQSFKGETPAARREARHQLAGVLGMMGAMAGVTGMFGFNLAMTLAGLIFGDDDDPLDFEQRFRGSVIDILGPELGGVVLNGAPGHYLGIDLASRIGMPDLWFRSPGRELQGKDEYQYWLSQSLGATVSLGEQIYRGFELATDGDIARGLEMVAPKAVRDLIRSYRYASEGVTSIGGNEVLPASGLDYSDLLAQTVGFTPAKVAETWERNSALKNAETRVREKRQRLINRWALATMMGDKAAAGDALGEIKAFNAVKLHAGVAITKETLQRSIRTRARNAAKREDGVLVSNQDLGRELRERLPDTIYR
ncbi:PLxRFG domain-containing protein [Shinella pollutisoli]|uniref:PLxRFG domain-containing protein n=1 Tax=Shinella pollutisoli TaxID=2250594 RepID=A0ABV7DKH4_9HYPH|nr:PLxRFG domain-containing protein [Shinella pollutisoli]